MMRKKLLTTFALAIACSACLVGGSVALNGQKIVTATASTVSTERTANFSFTADMSDKKNDGQLFAREDALAVNYPSTTTQTYSGLRFGFENTITATSEKAIRLHISTVVPFDGREGWWFGVTSEGGNTAYIAKSATDSTTHVWRESVDGIKNVEAKKGDDNYGLTCYILDNVDKARDKMTDSYISIPLSQFTLGDEIDFTKLTGVVAYTSQKYAKNIWNFGEIDLGTLSDTGEFTEEQTIWSPFTEDGQKGDFMALNASGNEDTTVVADIIRGGTFVGANNGAYLTSTFESETETIDISNVDGVKFYVDNSQGKAAKSVQLFLYDESVTMTAGAMTNSWYTNVGFAYFTPDEDCTAFKNSFGYRSRFVPAGFKGEMYVPFLVYDAVNSASGGFLRNGAAPTSFPTTILDDYQILYSNNAGEPFVINFLGFIADDTAYMKEAFETTSAANLATDKENTVLVQSTGAVQSQFELWTNNESGVLFNAKATSTNSSTGAVSVVNGTMLGGGALAVYVENLKARPFEFQVKTHNTLGEIVALGGEIAEGSIKFVQEDGSVQILTMKRGVVTIPASAKGTLVVPYVGAAATTTKSNTCNWKYPVDGIFRLIFNAEDSEGSAAYLLGRVAVVKDNGTCNEIKISGTGISAVAATSEDGAYKKNRSNIAYSGVFSWGQLIKPTMTTGAFIRLKADAANSGLRFETNYDQAAISAINAEIAKDGGEIKDVSYGTLIVPENYLSDTVVPTFESLQAADKKYLDVKSSGFHSTSTETTAKYWGAIIDVLPANYAREFIGLGYAKLTMADNSIVYVYADYLETNVRSIATIAQVVYSDRSTTQDGSYKYLTEDGDYSRFTVDELAIIKRYIG